MKDCLLSEQIKVGSRFSWSIAAVVYVLGQNEV